jgi:uncharacterized protein
VSDRWFLRVFEAVSRNKRLVLALLALLVVTAGFSLRWVPFENSLDLMLPDRSEARRMLQLLREANFSDKVVITLEAEGVQADSADLLAAADHLAASLQPPLVTRVVSEFSNPDIVEDFVFFLRNLPQLLDSNDLATVGSQLTPDGVARSLRARYLQLMKPEGLFMGSAIRADPLDLGGIVSRKITRLSASLGYRVKVDRGHLVSEDGRQVMLILQTPVPLTDAAGSKQLVGYLRKQFAALPSGIEPRIICGHLHTLSNERIIKRDIAVTNLIDSVMFVTLFFVAFRNARAVLMILLTPIAAALTAVPLSSLFVDKLSYLVVGLGSVITGVAIDYGIHVYVAVRHSKNKAAAVHRIALPVSLGAFSTLSMFIAFLFSHIPGYRQLAWFSGLSILLSLGCALFVFPQFVQPLAATLGSGPVETGAPQAGRRNGLRVAVWCVLVLMSLPLCFRVPFDQRITQMDGTEKAILKTEEDFRAVWGQGEGSQALLMVSGANDEEARRINDRVYEDAASRLGPDALTSLASVWPSRETRAENAAGWVRFWKDGREEKLKRLLAEQGARYSFAADAFTPFFENLDKGTAVAEDPPGNQLLGRLEERFVGHPASGGCRILSFSADDDRTLQVLSDMAAKHPGVELVSPKAFASSLSRTYSREITRISVIAVSLIIFAVLVLQRNVRLAAVSLVPPVTAVVGLLTVMSLAGLHLNVANLIAGIVVFGLSLDYGFVMMHSYRYGLTAHTKASVHMSAVTTVIGTGVLLFALHPALFSIGFTLTIGVLSGYLSAMLVVPSLYAVFFPAGERGGR